MASVCTFSAAVDHSAVICLSFFNRRLDQVPDSVLGSQRLRPVCKASGTRTIPHSIQWAEQGPRGEIEEAAELVLCLEN